MTPSFGLPPRMPPCSAGSEPTVRSISANTCAVILSVCFMPNIVLISSFLVLFERRSEPYVPLRLVRPKGRNRPCVGVAPYRICPAHVVAVGIAQPVGWMQTVASAPISVLALDIDFVESSQPVAVEPKLKVRQPILRAVPVSCHGHPVGPAAGGVPPAPGIPCIVFAVACRSHDWSLFGRIPHAAPRFTALLAVKGARGHLVSAHRRLRGLRPALFHLFLLFSGRSLSPIGLSL